MLTLRGHHLICLHFFNGEGYDAAFTENLKNVLKRSEDEDIEICDGADDVCEKCPYLKDNKCQYDEGADEEIKEMDEMASSLLKIANGTKIRWQEIKERIPEIFSQWFANYCYDCDWNKVCEKNEFYQRLKGGI
jgi:hypothetical protein